MKGLLTTCGALLAALVAVMPASPASAQAVQTISVVNHANVQPWVLRRVEDATMRQVNGPVRRAWGTPKIRYGVGGLKLTLRPQLFGVPFPQGCAPTTPSQACHSYLLNAEHTPFIVVATFSQRWSDGIPPQWTPGFAHEIIETLTDLRPNNHIGEVCDATGDSIYQVASGVFLPDFETPAGNVGREIN